MSFYGKLVALSLRQQANVMEFWKEQAKYQHAINARRQVELEL